MQKNTSRTASLVEAGILSAIAVVFALINLYTPFLGAFLNVVWPVPLIILGVRHGLRWSGLSLLTAGTIVALLVNPLQSLLLVIGLGFIGLTLGWSIRKNNPPLLTIGIGSIVSFIAKILVFALIFLLVGVNPLDVSPETVTKITDDVINFYRSMGVSEADLERNRAMMEPVFELMRVILPAGIILASFIDTFINFWVSQKILRRLGSHVPDLPAFRNLVFPQSILLFYGLSLLSIYFFREQQPLETYHRIAINFNMLCGLPILLQGVAVAWSHIDGTRWANVLRGLLLGSLFVTQFMPLAMVFLGIADFVMDFRKLRPPRG